MSSRPAYSPAEMLPVVQDLLAQLSHISNGLQPLCTTHNTYGPLRRLLLDTSQDRRNADALYRALHNNQATRNSSGNQNQSNRACNNTINNIQERLAARDPEYQRIMRFARQSLSAALVHDDSVRGNLRDKETEIRTLKEDNDELRTQVKNLSNQHIEEMKKARDSAKYDEEAIEKLRRQLDELRRSHRNGGPVDGVIDQTEAHIEIVRLNSLVSKLQADIETQKLLQRQSSTSDELNKAKLDRSKATVLQLHQLMDAEEDRRVKAKNRHREQLKNVTDQLNSATETNIALSEQLNKVIGHVDTFTGTWDTIRPRQGVSQSGSNILSVASRSVTDSQPNRRRVSTATPSVTGSSHGNHSLYGMTVPNVSLPRVPGFGESSQDTHVTDRGMQRVSANSQSVVRGNTPSLPAQYTQPHLSQGSYPRPHQPYDRLGRPSVYGPTTHTCNGHLIDVPDGYHIVRCHVRLNKKLNPTKTSGATATAIATNYDETTGTGQADNSQADASRADVDQSGYSGQVYDFVDPEEDEDEYEDEDDDTDDEAEEEEDDGGERSMVE